MFENMRLAFQSIWNHKMRSFLTMLGIIIGIAAMITIVSSIKGTNDQIKENLVGSGTNAVVVRLYQSDMQVDMEYASLPQSITPISEETRQDMERLDGVEQVSLFRERPWSYNVYYQDVAYNGSVTGIDSHYFDVCGYRLCYGRDFTQEDFDTARKVVILDARTASSLFGGVDPVGQSVEMAGQPFTVIGVVAKGSAFSPVIDTLDDYWTYADTSSGNMFITSEAWPIVYRYDEPQTVALQASGVDEMATAGKAAADYLTDKQIADHSSEYTYRSEDMLEQAQELQAISNSTNNQLFWIASISLLVGGIGVMNIMLVSVTERTSEIGLKKAIGAKKRRIMRQFLTEAAVLTSLGGVLGVAAGIGLAQMISSATKTPVAISIPAILIAVVFSMAIGILFGLFPAIRAAQMNPIDALRRE